MGTQGKDQQVIPGHQTGRKRGCVKPICFIVAVVLIAWAINEWRMGRRADSIMAELQAGGFPVTIEALRDSYVNVPHAENAAEKYIEAIIEDRMFTLGWDVDYMLPVIGVGEQPDPDEPWPSELLAVVGRYLDANARTLSLIHEAAARPAGRYPLEFGPDVYDSLHLMAPLRHLSRIAKLEALYHVERSDSDRAVQAVLATLAVGRSLEGSPLLFPQAVRLSTAGMAVYALEQVMNLTVLPEETLEELAEAFAWPELNVGLGQSEVWRRGCAGEMCLFASYFADSTTYMAATDALNEVMMVRRPIPRPVRHVVYRMLSNTDRALGLGALRALMEGKTPDQGIAIMPLEHAQMEIIGWALPLAIRSVSRLRLANAALAIEHYRVLYGALPETLEALTPEFLSQVPLDPWSPDEDPGPIKYNPTDEGFMVYSVGKNGVDDDGVAAELYEEGDDTFSVSFE